MVTKLISIEEWKSIFTEILLNKTDKVSKITDGSSVNGIAFGSGKLAQKVQKDVAIIESQIFPDVATGIYLDAKGRLDGYGVRIGAKRSSCYVRVSANTGTQYTAGVHVFISNTGVQFDLEKDYTMTNFGFAYLKVRSKIKGDEANVDALTINSINPVPVGHKYCINEYAAQYGTDSEMDDVFRKRIKESPNLLSRGTIAMLEQVFAKINENVLRVFYGGLDVGGKLILNILTENGIDLNTLELNDILIRAEKFLGLTEMRPLGYNGYGIVMNNIQFQPLDISFRCELEPSFDPDEVRKEVQIRMNKYIDYRYWRMGQKVEWDNLLEIAKSTDGVRYVNDAYFYPNTDVTVNSIKLPRIRGFQMLDLDGNIIFDFSGNLNPVYYPTQIDFAYQATVLQNI